MVERTGAMLKKSCFRLARRYPCFGVQNFLLLRRQLIYRRVLFDLS